MSSGLIVGPSSSLSSIFTARPEARTRMRDFFSSHIRNPNTRRAYREAVRQFTGFCAEHGLVDLAQIEPVHVAAFVEAQLKQNSKPTVKQRLAALRMLFDWMVVGQVLPGNPAHAVRGPKHTQRAVRCRSCRPTRRGRCSTRSTPLPCPTCATER
jgi:site-specific recombinase XerD